MTLLDVSIVNVALPSIRLGLGAGDSALQWVVSGYSLTFGLLLVPAGRLGDARDRRKVFMLGVSGLSWPASPAAWPPPRPGWSVPGWCRASRGERCCCGSPLDHVALELVKVAGLIALGVVLMA